MRPRLKIKPSDLLKGSNIDWASLAAQQQAAAASQVNPQMPTRTRGGGYRKAGISGTELEGMKGQNGEAGLSAKEPTKEQYEKMAAARTDGVLPEQATAVDRTQRAAVDGNNITDPVRQSRVRRMAEAIQGDTGAVADGTTTQDVPKVDSYEKMLEFLKAQQVADADADRRARRREMMAAIGDGISAISSLYQTTKGAPVTYTPGHDMSEAMRQRFDRLTAQRKADSDKYLTYLKMQAARDAALADARYKARRLAADEDRNERENRKLDWLIEHGKNQDNAKQYSNETNRQHLERTDEMKKNDQERKDKDSENKRENNNKRTESYVAAQGRRGSGKSRGRGGSSSGEYTTETKVKYVMDDYGNKIGEERTTTKKKSPTAGTKTTKKKSPTKK